jgi:hypothetical protein
MVLAVPVGGVALCLPFSLLLGVEGRCRPAMTLLAQFLSYELTLECCSFPPACRTATPADNAAFKAVAAEL